MKKILPVILIFQIFFSFSSFSQDTSVVVVDSAKLVSQDSLKISLEDTIKIDTSELNFKLLNVAYTGNTDSVLQLLEMGADPKAADGDSVTALMFASQEGHLEIVKILLHNGADPGIQTHYTKKTALYLAVTSGNFDIAEALAWNGANLNIADRNNATALHYAVVDGSYFIADMLLYYGANPNAKAVDSVTPLMIAAAQPDTAMLNLLLRKGANPILQDKHGFSALMFAVQDGLYDNVKLLLKAGSNINEINNENHTALSIAIKNGDAIMTEILIESGANPNYRIGEKTSMMDLARFNYQKDISRQLALKGGKVGFFPKYNLLFLGYGMNWNFDDLFFSHYVGIFDTRHYTSFSLGFESRYFPKRVIVDGYMDMKLQMWEKRRIMYLKFNKRFPIRSNSLQQKGLQVGIKETMPWGKYKGSNLKIDNDFVLVPSAGIFYSKKDWGLELNYEYHNLGLEGISPHRFVISIFGNIPLKKVYTSDRIINWL